MMEVSSVIDKSVVQATTTTGHVAEANCQNFISRQNSSQSHTNFVPVLKFPEMSNCHISITINEKINSGQ